MQRWFEQFGNDLLDVARRFRLDQPDPVELHWLAIEVLDPLDTGPSTTFVSERQWWEAWRGALVGEAMATGSVDFDIHMLRWGVVFEVGFRDFDGACRFRELTVVRAAFDQIGLLGITISLGRRGGGGAGVRHGRRRPPLAGAGAAVLPLPEAEPDELTPTLAPLPVPALSPG